MSGLVGNVIFDDDEAFGFAAILAEADHGVERDGLTWFSPYLWLFDEDDPDDGPLYLMYGSNDGGTVYAPDCNDVNELERRLVRALGDTGWTIDDHGETTPTTPLMEAYVTGHGCGGLDAAGVRKIVEMSQENEKGASA